MIKLIIFDLDNTLFDTYGQLGVRILDKMIKGMKEHGLTGKQEKIMRKKYMTTSFRIIAQQLGLSDELTKIGIDTYKQMDLRHITPYSDVHLIRGFKQIKALVTTGTKDLQFKKIETLGIGSMFNEIHVDESSILENKQRIFAMLMEKYNLKPKEVMVIGDNSESEIAAGNKLGMVTVQILRRRFLKGDAWYHVGNLRKVKRILNKLEKKEHERAKGKVLLPGHAGMPLR